MKKRIEYIPFIAVTAFFIFNKTLGFETAPMKGAIVLLAAAGLGAVFCLRRSSRISPIHKGMVAFLVLAVLAFWVLPTGAGRLVPAYPATTLHAVLFLIAVGPPILGREVFTMHFARKTTPETVWKTDVFKTINYHLTALWALLFFCSMVSGLLPGILGLDGPVYGITFDVLLPAALMLGIGLPVTRHYPGYYQRKLDLAPVRPPESGPPKNTEIQRPSGDQNFISHQPIHNVKMEEPKMSQNPTIVAVNGSPRAGVGNTSMMIEMLRDPLSQKGFNLEIINLCGNEINYCYGCGVCLEKGKCWIDDDHRGIAQRLLAADGIIFASPVYIFSVTAQMKAFLDRSLAYGHKPRSSWKPGMSVCVSSGSGETEVGDYLADILRIYGAFAVGTLTAISVGPGEFMGMESVTARAQDLAHDLARAIKEKRRYPATDRDLRFYHFMGDLVKNHKDTAMKHDYKHWQAYGFYKGFETYIQQPTHKPSYNPQARDAWIKELIAQHKKKGKKIGDQPKPAKRGPQAAKNCAQLLQMMPLGFNQTESNGLEAIYQFEISGEENFTAHLKISKGTCTYHAGPADHPNVIVKTPADVWLAISKGELDGQQAFMSGKYKVEGDLSLLLRLKSLFAG
ncbi:MAG: NAD(P)H-dependent oxidoreductase [Deltaproteobacteria bacterium]|jgi:multimeric flavodoxin WrbA/putative sterol carrier protein